MGCSPAATARGHMAVSALSAGPSLTTAATPALPAASLLQLQAALEPLLDQHSVDVALAGHHHRCDAAWG